MTRIQRFADDCILALSLLVILQSAACWHVLTRDAVANETTILRQLALPKVYRHVFRAGLPITCAAIEVTP